MKKVLLLPSDHGGGRGHVARSLYLAQKLNQSGCQTAVVLDRHFNKQKDPLVNLIRFNLKWEKIVKYQLKRPVKPSVRLTGKLSTPPVFHQIGSLAYQVPRDGYVSERIVKYRLKQFGKIIDRFKPDVLIGDTHLLTRLIGKRYDIPVVQITRLAGFPERPNFSWWRQDEPPLTEPDGTAPFRKAARDAGLEELQRTEDLLKGDRYVIPAIYKIEPVRNSEKDIYFTGPLNPTRFTPKRIPFSEEKNEYPRIYITIGGGSTRYNEVQFFDTLIDIFNKSEFKVLITTAGKAPAKQFNGKAANVYFVDWVDGPSAVYHSDLVVHHGGYSTMIETLLIGKPAVVLPSHSEQEGNGNRLRKLQVGEVIPIYNEPLTPLEFTWPYGKYTMNVAYTLDVNGTQLKQKINDLLYGGAYDRLKRLSAQLTEKQEETDYSQIISF